MRPVLSISPEPAPPGSGAIRRARGNRVRKGSIHDVCPTRLPGPSTPRHLRNATLRRYKADKAVPLRLRRNLEEETLVLFSRFSLPAGALLLALAPGIAVAQTPPVPVSIDPAPDFDYIQQAASMAFDGTTLTLSGLAPSTIYFSDRPYRETGQVDTATFLALWDKDGSFAGDPPNAAVTALSAPNAQPAVVELSSPELEGDDLKYSVKVLSGELPASASDIALFVDRGSRPRRTSYKGSVKGTYYPVQPLPGPYCYHDPQAPECHYHPYHPYYPPYRPYYPGAYAAGVATGAAIASANQPQPVYYIYPIPTGQLPPNCYINSTHTEMVCTVPLQQ